ncbi:MAG TPA: GNAT family N-acetyltransferase [Polyangiaceae bacterium]
MDTAQTNELAFEAAEARHAAALVDLFARTNTPCHCQYWHFPGDKNAWLDRMFHAPDENRAAFVRGLDSAELKGVVALAGERAVGWMKLCAAERVPKLYEQRLYKALPCFAGPRDAVLTIGCMLVDEDFRRRGVARSLIQSGVGLARKSGARAIEAFPRCSEHAQAPELWLGPMKVFLEAGFQVVNDFAPYPVLRYDVSGF